MDGGGREDEGEGREDKGGKEKEGERRRIRMRMSNIYKYFFLL